MSLEWRDTMALSWDKRVCFSGPLSNGDVEGMGDRGVKTHEIPFPLCLRNYLAGHSGVKELDTLKPTQGEGCGLATTL